VSNGSIYHHFASKEAVLVELLVQAITQYQDELLAVLDRYPSDAEGGVRTVVAFHLAWAEQNRREAQLLLDYRDAVDGADARAALRERNRPFLAAIADWLGHQSEAGSLGDIDVMTAHALVFAPAQELTRVWLRGQLLDAPSSYADSVGAAAWAGLVAASR
jgi:AcrR family transcriptional regulator